MTISAEDFARNAHAGQMYGDVPYWHHLQSVVTILADFGYTERWADAGWLHDTVEEPGVKEETIERLFGDWVRQTVHACYGAGKYRIHRNADMYNRIALFPEAAPVKMADRISHIEAAIPGSSKAKMYLKERSCFRAHVAVHAPSSMHLRLELGYDKLKRLQFEMRQREERDHGRT